MASVVTYSELKSRAKARSDMANSNFITDAEWLQFINSSTQSLYDLLVSKNEDYYVTSVTISANGTDRIFRLPQTFYKLLGVDYQLHGRTCAMERYNFQERNRNNSTSDKLKYRIVGQNIHFSSVPAAQSLTLWIIPAFTPFENDDDEFDGINGWEEWVVVDAAIKAKDKEESDATLLVASKAELTDRIEKLATPRDQGRPERVVDLQSANDDIDDIWGRYGF
jgi:hypothetical protein